MTTSARMYRELAANSQAQADAASLGNVRARHRLSAETWLKMAERFERVEQARISHAHATLPPPI